MLLLLVLVAGGCKKDDEPTTAPEAQVIPTELIGTWTAQSAMLGGQPITIAKAFGLVAPATAVKQSYAGNGAFSFSVLDAGNVILNTLNGSAVVTGAYITCTVPMSDGTTLKLVDGRLGGNRESTRYQYLLAFGRWGGSSHLDKVTTEISTVTSAVRECPWHSARAPDGIQAGAGGVRSFDGGDKTDMQ